ncbi:MAG: IPT/TIG domain-containing protein [Terracidiphilus sp.]
MKLTEFAVLAVALSAPCLLGAAASGPVVNSGTINYPKNQVTLVGSGFKPATTAPTVQLSNTALSLVLTTNNQIVAKLPGSVAAGTFRITVTASGGASTVFDLTYGTEGPQGVVGPAGPAGAQGVKGAQGVVGPVGPAGPSGPTGPTGPQGPKGQVLSYSANGALSNVVPVGELGRFSVAILKNPGTYILTGQLVVVNELSSTANVVCKVFDAQGMSQQTAPNSPAQLGPNGYAALSLNGIWVAAQANTSIWVECEADYGSTDVETNGEGSFTAIQVQ